MLTLSQKGERDAVKHAEDYCMECPLWLVHFPLPSFTPDSCVFLAQHRPGRPRKPSVTAALRCWDQTKGLAHIRQVLDPRATAQVLG